VRADSTAIFCSWFGINAKVGEPHGKFALRGRREESRAGKRTRQSASDWCIMNFDYANRASQISDAIHPLVRDSIFLEVCFLKEGGMAWQKISFYNCDT
jgi:hypothetical protein